jgi:hypothetical protein
MHCIFHILVTDEMTASRSVFERTKKAKVRRSQISIMWRMLQHLRVQLAGAFGCVGGSVWMNTTVQHLSTTVLGIWL